MARNIRMHAGVFMRGVLGALNTSVPTHFDEVVGIVSQDADERESVRRVLGVMVKQKYVTQEGEGDAATYTLTESGQALHTNIQGA